MLPKPIKINGFQPTSALILENGHIWVVFEYPLMAWVDDAVPRF
jgi:hypothetical protein